jgi:hypothetical protein
MKQLAATQPVELQCHRSGKNRRAFRAQAGLSNGAIFAKKILMRAKVMAETLQINELTNRIAYSLALVR